MAMQSDCSNLIAAIFEKTALKQKRSVLRSSISSAENKALPFLFGKGRR